MKRIFVPTQTGSDWHRLLAKPDLHWKRGRSAMTAAACWDSAGDHLPTEIGRTLSEANVSELKDLRLLAAVPEWEIPLPGGNRASFTDVLALATNSQGLCVIAVEAKAGEDFGPTVSSRKAEKSEGQGRRMAYLEGLLAMNFEGGIRYQLLHRTASALLAAQDFHARTAVMLVHAWNSTPEQRKDFEAFCDALNAERRGLGVRSVARSSGPALYLAWCDGDPRFLQASLAPGV